MAQHLENMKSYKQSIDEALNNPNAPWAKVFGLIEAKTGVKRIYVFLGNVFPVRIFCSL